MRRDKRWGQASRGGGPPTCAWNAARTRFAYTATRILETRNYPRRRTNPPGKVTCRRWTGNAIRHGVDIGLVRAVVPLALVLTLALPASTPVASGPDVEAVPSGVGLSSQPCIERLQAGLECPLWLDAQPTGESECPYLVLGHRVCPGSPAGWGERAKLEAFAIGCALRGQHLGLEEKALCAGVPIARLVISGHAPACRHEALSDPFDPAFDAPVCLNFGP